MDHKNPADRKHLWERTVPEPVVLPTGTDAPEYPKYINGRHESVLVTSRAEEHAARARLKE